MLSVVLEPDFEHDSADRATGPAVMPPSEEPPSGLRPGAPEATFTSMSALLSSPGGVGWVLPNT